MCSKNRKILGHALHGERCVVRIGNPEASPPRRTLCKNGLALASGLAAAWRKFLLFLFPNRPLYFPYVSYFSCPGGRAKAPAIAIYFHFPTAFIYLFYFLYSFYFSGPRISRKAQIIFIFEHHGGGLVYVYVCIYVCMCMYLYV